MGGFRRTIEAWSADVGDFGRGSLKEGTEWAKEHQHVLFQQHAPMKFGKTAEAMKFSLSKIPLTNLSYEKEADAIRRDRIPNLTPWVPSSK